MKNTLLVLKQVERTHPNLGLPILFAKLIDMSNIGCFLIAERGKGKTTALDVIRDSLRHRDLMQINIISYAGLAKMASEMSGRRITMINRDFSSFYTDYLKDVAINLIAGLITDHSIKADTQTYSIKIDDCVISFLSATQPQMLEKLNRIPTWESMYRDRFIRFPMLYWFGTPPKYQDKMPEVSTVEIIPDAGEVSLPNSIKEIESYERMAAILERQTSASRCRLHLDAMLRAHAAFNMRDIVLPKDLEFIELFAGNLMLDYLVSDRQRGVSRPLVFNSNSYIIFSYLLEHGGASRAQMRQHWSVSQITIQRNLNPLMARNLIKGTYGKDWYVVNPKWLEKYANPIHKWFDKNGIRRMASNEQKV